MGAGKVCVCVGEGVWGRVWVCVCVVGGHSVILESHQYCSSRLMADSGHQSSGKMVSTS